ncbi:hypothetical protein [Exiguobacterium sp. BG5(2022)]|uniref:hypothetical protein n=1 Tax=Exiguobacterium sp. BG5(2022) TaxID=2962595 RepID=UPI0028824181|nr:hypothetical protein [Exiguobacterium sp. BG5(2022)]MDT0193713.1 hypothetical protein [Exiguobacterium sp. BG5(2022)]
MYEEKHGIAKTILLLVIVILAVVGFNSIFNTGVNWLREHDKKNESWSLDSTDSTSIEKVWFEKVNDRKIVYIETEEKIEVFDLKDIDYFMNDETRSYLEKEVYVENFESMIFETPSRMVVTVYLTEDEMKSASGAYASEFKETMEITRKKELINE